MNEILCIMLKNSVAIVTGATSGIGRAIALGLAKEGCSVAAVGRRRCDEELLSGISANGGLGFQYDITQKNAPNELFDDVQNKLGIPNILINNAGVTKDSWIWKITEEDWDEVLNLNLKAPFMMTRVFSQRLMQEPCVKDMNANIINISSLSGKIGNYTQSNYSASKAGLIGLTKSCAKDLAASNIRVNAVIPGFISTPMTLQLPKKQIQHYIQEIPLKKIGDPCYVADSIVFLASTKSKYITGTTLEVTGGLIM